MTNDAERIRVQGARQKIKSWLVAQDSPVNGNGDAERQRYTVSRTFRVTLGDLADRIHQLHAIRETLIIPDLADDLMKCLHATYLSFLPEDDFSYQVKMFTDERGWLFELIKSTHFGQIFVSKTLPGITRGDHYHDTKLEKFCVIRGLGFSLLEAASIFGRHGYQKVIFLLYG